MAVDATIRETAAQRFDEIHDELRSRSWAANAGLPPCDREEAQAEAYAYARSWMLAAAEKGRLDRLTPFSMAKYVRLLFRSGRRSAGNASRDALDPQARVRANVGVVHLDDLDTRKANGSVKGRAVSRALTDSRIPRPDEQTRVDLGGV